MFLFRLLHLILSLIFPDVFEYIGNYSLIGDSILFIVGQIIVSYLLDDLCEDYDSRKDNLNHFEREKKSGNVHLIILQHGFCSHFSRLFWFAKFYKTLYNLEKYFVYSGESTLNDNKTDHPLLKSENLKYFFGSQWFDKSNNFQWKPNVGDSSVLNENRNENTNESKNDTNSDNEPLIEASEEELNDEVKNSDRNININGIDDIIIHIARCNSNGPTMGFWSTNDGIETGG